MQQDVVWFLNDKLLCLHQHSQNLFNFVGILKVLLILWKPIKMKRYMKYQQQWWNWKTSSKRCYFEQLVKEEVYRSNQKKGFYHQAHRCCGCTAGGASHMLPSFSFSSTHAELCVWKAEAEMRPHTSQCHTRCDVRGEFWVDYSYLVVTQQLHENVTLIRVKQKQNKY